LERSRGRRKPDPRDARIAELERRAQRTEAELDRARRVIEIQANVSALLEQMLEAEGADGSTER